MQLQSALEPQKERDDAHNGQRCQDLAPPTIGLFSGHRVGSSLHLHEHFRSHLDAIYHQPGTRYSIPSESKHRAKLPGGPLAFPAGGPRCPRLSIPGS